ncbi:2OG-Fe(II) oxygenase [Variovorax humicola]|uniref:2OG-Fe(II) oxygenase n=1 Tax=Variovorax humicola TaxID=1769758 RepID=A0ABU8VRY7_9BURK
MDITRDLLPTWRDWIVENLQRGCAPDSLIEAMRESDFDAPHASALVHEFRQRLESGEISKRHGVQSLVPARTAFEYGVPRLPGGNTIETEDGGVCVAMRIARPVVAVLNGVLSAAECDALINLSRARLERSTIVDPGTGEHGVIKERTSEGTFFMPAENELVSALDRRIAQIMNCPLENGEGLQILHYGVGAQYTPHFDYFPPDQTGSTVHLARGGQRVSTLIIYLNEVTQGGGTIFPELNLTVVPKKGSAVYFEYLNDRGQVDPMTLHGGAPVIQGEKWIATKWMRVGRFE